MECITAQDKKSSLSITRLLLKTKSILDYTNR